nr:hypothetical protein [uncultured Psychroserpens sp.]
MKFIIKPFSVLCLCVLLIGCDKFKPTQKSKDSFKSAFNAVNWNNATPSKKSLNTTCTAKMLQMALDSLPKQFYVDKGSHAELYGYLSDMYAEFDHLIKTYDLESKLAEDTGLTTISAKDKVLNAWSGARGSKDFIKKVKTRRDGKFVDWENKEAKLDIALLILYREIESMFTVKGQDIKINDCRILINQAIDIRKITSTKITLIPFCAMFFTCQCTEKSTKKDLKDGRIAFSTVVEATFQNDSLDLNAMIFKTKGNPVYSIYEADCCKDKNEDKEKD